MELYKDKATKEAAQKKRVDRQEKYAKENYAGVEEMGDQLLELIEYHDELFKKYVKLHREEAETDEIESDLDEVVSQMETLLTVLSIKLTNSTGHALNAKSTKYIKKIISFMDKLGISDKPIHSGIIRVVSKRIGNGGLYEMALVVAALNNDLEFAKEIFRLAEKNKNRKNIFEDIYRMDYSFRSYGDFSQMSKIYNIERIAFEALVSGHKDVYEFLNSKAELQPKFIEQFINPQYGRSGLLEEEAMNLVNIKPEFLEFILEKAEYLLPQSVKDMFIF
jgi:hypothetical protein